MSNNSDKADIRLLSISEMESLITKTGEAKYRAGQIHDWIWKKGAISFEEMTNLSISLRESLANNYAFKPISEDLIQKSTDGTIKLRFKLYDENKIESVLIPVPEDRRYTACVSSQVGCSLSCSFCATGKMKRMRNLDPGEIYDQVKLVNELSQREYGHPLTNIVFMGMGEPLLNYKNVMRAIELISSDIGLGMSAKRVTISTAGIAKMIRQMAEENAKIRLALSLHAADDAKRNEIMPINESNNLSALLEAMTYYYSKTRNKISYEYIAFKGFNDTIEDARNLLKLCKSFPVLINIIEYNPVEGVPFAKASDESIDAFAAFLRNSGIMVTVRKSRGKDIDAACGQLANKE